MLLSSDGSELLWTLPGTCPSQQSKDLRYRCGEGVVGRVVQTGQTAIIPRISQEPRFTNRIHRRDKADEADASFLCVPIALGSEVVGTLSVDLPIQQAGQLQRRAQSLEIVATMIAFDVKARRIEALQRQHLEQQKTCAFAVR